MRFTRRLAAIVTATALALGLAIVPAATASANQGFEIAATDLGTITVGESLSRQLTTNGGIPATWSIQGGGGFPWLTLTPGGLLTATAPPEDGYVVHVRAQSALPGDNRSDVEWVTFVVDPAPPTLTPATLAPATVGVSYSQQLSATGVAAGARYRTVGGAMNGPYSLGNGLSLSNNGSITGTPTLPGGVNSATVTFSAEVGVSRLGPWSTPVTFAVTIGRPAPVVTTSSLPAATVGAPYTATLAASGGGVLTYAASGLPAGLNLNAATGVISGTPTFNGYTVSPAVVPVSVTASNGAVSAARALSIAVTTPAPTLGAMTLPDAPNETPYSAQLPLGGQGSVALKAGSFLPAGLTLSASGVISGSPRLQTQASRNYGFTVVASGVGGSVERAYSLLVSLTPPSVVTETLPDGWLTQSYSQRVQFAGMPSGLYQPSWPAGLRYANLFTSGVDIVGTPTQAGVFALVFRLVNDAGEGAKTLTLTVNPAPVIDAAPAGKAIAGQSYSQQITATGKAVTFSLGAGAPAGMTITPAGFVQWTSTVGATTFPVIATNPSGSNTQTFSVFGYVAPTMVTTVLAPGIQDKAYAGTIVFSGVDATLTHTGGTLPPGLTLGSDGSLTGTPTLTGTYTFEVSATNFAGATPRTLSLYIEVPAPTIAAMVLPDAPVEAAYSQQLPVAGVGTAALKAGSDLPAGLTLAADGTISGTPDYDSAYGAEEDFDFTVVVTGPGGTNEETFALTVTVAAPTIATTALAEGWLTRSYTQALALAGPGAVLTVTGLPAGLSVDGDIVGTPTVAGEFPVTITVTNGAGTASRTITLVVHPAAVVTTTTVARAVVGTAYSQQFTATGTDVTFALAGAVPAGAAITPAGLLTWTPTVEGPTAFRVSATNLSGTDTRTFPVTSYVTPTITTGALTAGTQGVLYLGAVGLTGLDATASLPSGTLPAGVTMDSTGRLAGVPTQSGTFRFEVRASNFAGSVTSPVTLRIAAPVVPVTATGATPAGIADPLPLTQLPTEAAAIEAAAIDAADDAELPTLAETETAAAPDAAVAPANVLGFVLGGILLLMLALLVAFLVRRRQVAAD